MGRKKKTKLAKWWASMKRKMKQKDQQKVRSRKRELSLDDLITAFKREKTQAARVAIVKQHLGNFSSEQLEFLELLHSLCTKEPSQKYYSWIPRDSVMDENTTDGGGR